MHRHALILAAAFVAGAACGAPSPAERAREHLIVDTHIDVPYRLHEKFEDVTAATASGDFDWPRAHAGGLDVAFMSIYIPAEHQGTPRAAELAEEMIGSVEAIVERAPDKFMLVKSTADAERAHRTGKVGLAMGMENGTPIADFERLEEYVERGIRYVTLTHGKVNHISDSSYDTERRWNGLSEFGKALIPEMNRLGVMVDISHVSDDAFWQALEVSQAPTIASHSSARHFTPGFERNMSDDMIRALAAKGGVIQINFGSTFLTERARDWWDVFKVHRDPWLEARGLTGNNAAADAFRAGYEVENPFPYASLDDVLDHIDHVVAIAGVDHVGIGSDYDGVGDTLPVGLKSVADFPNLVAGLYARGYSDDEVAKVLGGNLMRVWRANEEFASRN